MSLAMFRVMWLSLLHDRGALAMAFLLPIAFFLVLAEIFSGASGAEMQLKLVIVDERGSELSQRLTTALLASDALEVVAGASTRAQAIELVRKGTADVGLIVRAEGRPLDDVAGFGPAPLLIVSDPARAVAVPMLSGQVQQAFFAALPDVALGSVVTMLEDQYVELDDTQRADIADGLNEMRAETEAGRQSGWSFAEMLEREDVAGQSAATNHVAYYAGAVAFLFLLFSSMQGALTLLEEQESGIVDRVLAGPGGIGVLIDGKFIYLVAQGFVQMLLIFVVAWLVYGVDLPGSAGAWLVITLAACVAATGLSLLVAASCRTYLQAQNFSTVLVLIVSVVGGSMVPRFFMPDWLRDLGWLTPNTWVLEAYAAVFWRGEPLIAVWLPCVLLGGLGLLGWRGARLIARRRAVL